LFLFPNTGIGFFIAFYINNKECKTILQCLFTNKTYKKEIIKGIIEVKLDRSSEKSLTESFINSQVYSNVSTKLTIADFIIDSYSLEGDIEYYGFDEEQLVRYIAVEDSASTLNRNNGIDRESSIYRDSHSSIYRDSSSIEIRIL
jgi:hypothetical protein